MKKENPQEQKNKTEKENQEVTYSLLKYKKILGIKMKDGWKSLGKIKRNSYYNKELQKNMICRTQCPICNRQLFVGVNENKNTDLLFYYCKSCKVEIGK